MMKYIKTGVVICAMLVLLPVLLSAQTAMKIGVKAIVRGTGGGPVAGAIVSTNNGEEKTVTDNKGLFSLNVDENSGLSISAAGYSTQSVNASAVLKVITLVKEEKPVQIAYRKVAGSDLLGGVSAVNVPEIMDKSYSTYSLDGMEAFTGGFNGNLWGMNSYLVLVDGVPRDAGNVLPSEIEQITFLKGVGAVALYGSRAAKGVVSITTKRGVTGAQKINVRANTGWYVPKSYPKYLGSAEYMTLYNEACQNDGLDKQYSDETIYNYASGKNPYRYADVDYYSSDYLKKAYNRTDATAEIYGGGEKARYYTNLGYNTSSSLLNFGEAIKNNSSNRFNVRGNIDVDLNEFISCKVDANAIIYTGKGVNADYWGSAATLRPYRFSPLIPISMIESNDDPSMKYVNTSNHIIDGKYLLGGTQLDQTNPFAAIYAGGHNTYNSRQFQFNTGIDANLNRVLDGLKFHSLIAVDYATSYSLAYNYGYAVYEALWNNYAGIDQISSLTKYNNDTKPGAQNVSNSTYSQTLAFSGQFDYAKTFNKSHNVTATLVAAGYQQSQANVYHATANANLGFQAGYNFKEKYYADFSSAMIHSAKLPENNRNAFSPTLSLGWRMSKEGFMVGASAVDDLKLTASAGILNTDLDISNYNLYQGYYTYTDAAWYSWRDGGLVHTFDRRRGDNPNMKYPQRKEVNLGVDASFFKKQLTFNGSFFANRITGNLIQSSILYPSYLSSGWPVYSDIPYANYEEDQRVGFDFNLNVNKRVGQTDLSLGVTGTYYDSKAIKRAENYADAYQNRAGKPLDGVWGLQNLGFYNNQDDITNSPRQTFGTVKPGDIKYKDQNGDGVIDTKDEVYLGRGGWSGAPLTLGVNFTAKWKNFTLFALGVGRFGGHGMKNSSYYWVDGTDKYSVIVRDRWTEATKATAKYPRLTTQNSDNNFRSSDFWLYSTNRFDLSKIQISYQLPKALLNKAFVKEMNVYMNGSNLLTIAPEREVLEMNVGSAPQTRFFNVGVKAAF
jgi:TonB-linked outer membrane protein, SusC/RagA family